MKSIPCWVVYLGVTSLMPGMSQSAQVTSNMELTSQDLQNLGEFIADLTRTLHVSVVSVCFNRLQALARRFVFVSRCHAHVPATSPRYCSAQSLHPPTTSPGAKPNPTPPDSSCWTRQHAEVYLTSPDDLAQTVQQVVQRYKSTGGSVSQVVLGRNLSFTDKVEPGVASWILASYTQATQQAVIQEVFTFRSSSESVVQLLGTWRPTTRLHLVHAPGQGPLNFNGQTIYLASFPYPPYTMEGEECPQSRLFWERDQRYRFDPHCYPRPP
ncbi:putative Ionotropic receptor 198-like, partial [Homarus americanus]